MTVSRFRNEYPRLNSRTSASLAKFLSVNMNVYLNCQCGTIGRFGAVEDFECSEYINVNYREFTGLTKFSTPNMAHISRWQALD